MPFHFNNERKVIIIETLSSICSSAFEKVLYLAKIEKLKNGLEMQVQERTINLEMEQQKRINETNEYRKKLEDLINRICHEIRYSTIIAFFFFTKKIIFFSFLKKPFEWYLRFTCNY